MTLRLRLLLSIVLSLLLACALAVTVSCVRAAGSVRAEVGAALSGSVQIVRNGIDGMGAGADLITEAARLVHSFNGSRHVQATLLDPDGRPIASSALPRPPYPAPPWFLRLVTPDQSQLLAVVAIGNTGLFIRLRADPLSEATKEWAFLENSAVDLLVLCLLAACGMALTLSRALRPLTQLAGALDRVEPGRRQTALEVRGPRDIARLVAGFNRMQERLAGAERQNRTLNEQIMTLVEEERAELAQDLHDEVGPYLFSIGVTVATLERLSGGEPGDVVSAHARLIREDLGHVQRHVRGILERLRPLAPIEAGLAAAIANIAGFWRIRRPEVTFRVDLDPAAEDWGEAAQDVVYRVVQEAVSNALRHATPSRVWIALAASANELSLEVTNDDTRPGAPPSVSGETSVRGFRGLGLQGMAARVVALGGTLAAGPRVNGPGWTVRARLKRDLAGTARMASEAITR